MLVARRTGGPESRAETTSSPTSKPGPQCTRREAFGDSFEETDLKWLLAARGSGRLHLAGAHTDGCIRSTPHGAIVRDYDATLVGDDHTTEDFAQFGAPPPRRSSRTRTCTGSTAGASHRHRSTGSPDRLFRAVVTARVSDLVAEAQRRAVDTDPSDASFAFPARLGAEGADKRDIPDAIAVPGPPRDELHDALEVLAHPRRRRRARRHQRHRPRRVAQGPAHQRPRPDRARSSPVEPGRAERILAVGTDGLRPPHPLSTSGARRSPVRGSVTAGPLRCHWSEGRGHIRRRGRLLAFAPPDRSEEVSPIHKTVGRALLTAVSRRSI